MKAKTQIDPNAAGIEVKRLLHEDGTANAMLRDLRSAKAARKEQLKAALTVVWQALESGATVNGFATKEEWCKGFVGCTMRHAQHLVYGRKPEANKRSLDITVSLADVNFNSNEAHAVVKIEQSHDLKYQGKRRNRADFSDAAPEEYEALDKEDKLVWTHTVKEISGRITVAVENEDGTMTEEQLVAALRAKVPATLKPMRLWNDDLTKEFDALVKEAADLHGFRPELRSQAAKRRSQAAKKAAQTRKKNKPAPEAPAKNAKVHFRHGERTMCGKKRNECVAVNKDDDMNRVTCKVCSDTLALGPLEFALLRTRLADRFRDERQLIQCETCDATITKDNPRGDDDALLAAGYEGDPNKCKECLDAEKSDAKTKVTVVLGGECPTEEEAL